MWGITRRGRQSVTAKSAMVALAAVTLTACSVTPEPLTKAEYDEVLGAALEQLPEGGQIIEAPLGLEDALVRAVRNNREVRLKAMEAALARGEVGLEAISMLPELTAEAGYTNRDVYDASVSATLNEDGINKGPVNAPSPTYSVSEPRDLRTGELGFSWNVLDFGLSYVRARQRADQYLISEERERKTVHTITQQVRAAYWKAVSADRLLGRVTDLRDQAEAALDGFRDMERSRAMGPREALIYQRDLLDVLRLLQDLERELSGAKVELADLMGLHPATEFTLEDVERERLTVPRLENAIAELEAAALNNRPEVREAFYQSRVSVKETRAALLRMLPGLNLTAALNYEDSIYRRDKEWQTLGASVNWNLFNVFALKPNLDAAEVRGQLAEARRLAVAMAVMSQVHLSVSDFMQTQRMFEVASDYRDVAGRILAQTESEVRSQSMGELEAVRESLNDILAELRRDRAYAELQNAFGRVAVSTGVDLFPRDYAELPAPLLAEVLEKRFEQMADGRLPLSPPQPVAGDAPEAAPAEEASDAAALNPAGAPVAQALPRDGQGLWTLGQQGDARNDQNTPTRSELNLDYEPL